LPWQPGSRCAFIRNRHLALAKQLPDFVRSRSPDAILLDLNFERAMMALGASITSAGS
jgi:hypothetical protein